MFKILNNWTIFWSFVITVDLYIRFESYIQFHYIKDRAAYNCTIERHVISNLKMRKRFSKKEKNRVMAPSISVIFKIQLTAGDDILERFRLEAEWACRWLRDGPFTEIFPCCKSAVQICDWNMRVRMQEMTNPCDLSSCVIRLSLSFWMAFRTCFVFLYWSYWTLQPKPVFAHNELMLEFGDDLRAFLMTVWHCKNFVEGRMHLIPYLNLGKMRVLRVAVIGSSTTDESNYQRDYLCFPLHMSCQD